MDQTPSNKNKRPYDEFDASPPPPPRYITPIGPSTIPVPWTNEPDPEPQPCSESGPDYTSTPRSWTPPPFPATSRSFSLNQATNINDIESSKYIDGIQVSVSPATKKRLGRDGKGTVAGAGKEERELSDREKVKLDMGRWEVERMTRYNNDEDFRRAWDMHEKLKEKEDSAGGEGEGKDKKKIIMFTISDGEDEDDGDEDIGGV